MAGPKPGGNNEGSNADLAAYFIVVVLLFLGTWALWTYAKKYIVYPAFAVDYAFIWAIEHTKGLGEGGTRIKAYIEGFFTGKMDASNPNQINYETFAYVREMVGTQVKWVISGVIVAVAVYVKLNMRGKGYEKKFSLAGGKDKGPSLADFQASYWKVVTYAANFDPDGRDKDIAPPLTPPEWMVANGVKYEDKDLDHDAARQAFVEQLGRPWHGFDRATLNGQVVMIICALHYLKLSKDKKSVSQSEREVLSVGWSAGRDGTPLMKALVEKYGKDPKVRKCIDTIASKHGYENTVIYAMLDRARWKGGVLKEHDMAYIKKLDRHMWYGMNNCGRKRFHTEGAGIMSHYFAERITNRALLEPYLDPACDGVDNYMREEGIDSLTEFYAVKDEDSY